MKNVCVLGDDQFGFDPQLRIVCKYLGEALAKRNNKLIFNGVAGGLIGELANSVLKKNGSILGVYNEAIRKKSIIFETEDEQQLERVKTSSEQKRRMIEEADVFVLIPSGLGSIHFFLELLDMIDHDPVRKQFAILNVNDFFISLLDYLNDLIAKGFLDRRLVTGINLSDNPWALLKLIDDKKHIIG